MLLACAPVRVMPQASSVPALELINQGDPAPGDGFFVPTEAMRAKLLSDALHDLETGEKLSQSEMKRKAAESRAARSEFCATYCLELGAAGVVVVELLAVGIYAAVRR